jgi:RND family efflux transporter MFP subunit
MSWGTIGETDARSARTKQENPSTAKRPLLKVIFGFGLVVFGALAFWGIIIRRSSNQELEQRSNQAAEVVVNVIHPQKTAETVPLTLPGETKAYVEAPIYAQTSGYLKKWYFDIGSKIKAGEVLAQIDTPEVDQQLQQSLANLKQAEAQLELSHSTYERNEDLYKRRVISAQDFDNANGDLKVKQATVNADQADVNRLQALQEFKIVRAPFDGIITVRSTDIGAYVPAGTGTQLFRIAQINPLRVYLNVPQNYALFVKKGVPSDLSLAEFPGRKFPAQVTRTAGAIDPTSRTLLTEMSVPNENGELFPGAFVQITLKLETKTNSLVIPSNTLLFRSDGTTVGVVKPDGNVEIRKIVITRDLGSKLEVAEGLTENEQLIVNPSDGLAEGMTVKVATPKKPTAIARASAVASQSKQPP